MAVCRYCAEAIEPGTRRCPHCGEALIDRSDLVAWLEDVEPDPTFASQVVEWPDDSLQRALRDHTDDYEPPQQRALVDEARRRGLPVPRRRDASGQHPAKIIGCAVIFVLLVLLFLSL